MLRTGVALMRAAFLKTTGPLRDTDMHDGEAEGVQQLPPERSRCFAIWQVIRTSDTAGVLSLPRCSSSRVA